uniref:Uncharacterized protein n=1 Tax=Ciona savignyi TaxID=51511 RepID=H2Y7X6_CIOSA
MRYTWIDSTSNDEMDEIFTILNEDKQDDELDSQTTDTADDNVTRLLFPSDHRMADAHHLLDSSVPVRLTMTQESGMDDRDFMEQKQLRLLQLLNRSTAQAIGRGMLTFQTQTPSAVRPLQVPLLNLHGKDTSNGTVNITGNTTFEIPPGLTDWPHFHNGVAAALSMQNDQNTQSWVHLNTATSDETNTTKDPSFEHAGTLFGFGLNHHLKELQTLNVHKYLQKTHETTTIGLLLGLASEK